MIWAFIIIPVCIWCALRLTLQNQKWEFDFDVAHSTFFLLLDRYQKIVGGMIFFALAGAAFGKWSGAPVSGIECCLAAAGYSFWFLVYTLTRYENYLHTRYPRDGSLGESPYTTSQYALTRTLGYSAVIFFIMGMVMVVTP